MVSQTPDLKRIALWFVIIVLGILVFLLIRPVFLSIVGGLLLAYIFFPAYKRLTSFIKNRSLAAFTIAILIVLIIIIPLWFLVPLMLQQVFNVFSSTQSFNVGGIVSSIFPTASAQFVAQMAVAIGGFIGKITTYALEYLNGIFLDIPILSLQLVIVAFVFYYGLKDHENLSKFVSDLSPFNKANEKIIVQQFQSVTDSVLYGQVIVGFVQGGLAGLGFLIFGVDNVLLLTTLAVFLSILPVLGPFLILIPVSIFFFASGQVSTGIAYIIYNLVIVTTVDNILRTYLVSRKTNISPAVILVAMIGGALIFGILGIFLGPLIVAYFIMFLKAYKDKSLHSLIIESE